MGVTDTSTTLEAEYHLLREMRHEAHKAKRRADRVAETLEGLEHVPDEYARLYEGIAAGLMMWVDYVDERCKIIREHTKGRSG